MKYILIILFFVDTGQLAGQCTLLGAANNDGNSKYLMYETTGNPRMDALFEQQIRFALVVFSLKEVDLYFYSASEDINAWAIPQEGMDMISFELSLIQKIRSEHPQRADHACAALIAHEMGHILQFELGGLGKLKGFQTELHADFLAGYFVGVKYDANKATDADAEVLFDLLFNLGDTFFHSRYHHGTPEQRKRAALAGFRYGKKQEPIAWVYEEGIRIVSRIQINDGKAIGP